MAISVPYRGPVDPGRRVIVFLLDATWSNANQGLA